MMHSSYGGTGGGGTGGNADDDYNPGANPFRTNTNAFTGDVPQQQQQQQQQQQGFYGQPTPQQQVPYGMYPQLQSQQHQQYGMQQQPYGMYPPPTQQGYGIPPQQQQPSYNPSMMTPDPNTGMTGDFNGMTMMMMSPQPHQQPPMMDPTQYLSGSMDQQNSATTMQGRQQNQPIVMTRMTGSGNNNNEIGSTQNTGSFWFTNWRGCWGVCCRWDSLQQYFDVDTADIYDRFTGALFSFWQPDVFRTAVVGDATMVTAEGVVDDTRKGPDLYGPFWIGITLMFLLAATSNLGDYMKHASVHRVVAPKNNSGSGGSSSSSNDYYYNSTGGTGDNSNNSSGNKNFDPSGGADTSGKEGDDSIDGNNYTLMKNDPTPTLDDLVNTTDTINFTDATINNLDGGSANASDYSSGNGGGDNLLMRMLAVPQGHRTSTLSSSSSSSRALQEDKFEYDLRHLSRAVTVVSIFAYGVPTVFWLVTKLLGMPGIIWPMWICCYGYAQVPYILAACVAWIPVEFFEWIFLAIATVMSGLLIVRNLSTPLLAQDSTTQAKAAPIILAILGMHFVYFLVLKFSFYP